jgi:hypothetical protein
VDLSKSRNQLGNKAKGKWEKCLDSRFTASLLGNSFHGPAGTLDLTQILSAQQSDDDNDDDGHLINCPYGRKYLYENQFDSLYFNWNKRMTTCSFLHTYHTCIPFKHFKRKASCTSSVSHWNHERINESS